MGHKELFIEKPIHLLHSMTVINYLWLSISRYLSQFSLLSGSEPRTHASTTVLYVQQLQDYATYKSGFSALWLRLLQNCHHSGTPANNSPITGRLSHHVFVRMMTSTSCSLASWRIRSLHCKTQIALK